MKTAGIVIDNWKLAIFKRHLDGAGYSYTEHPGLTENTMVLRVKCDLIAPLQRVLEAAVKECGT